MKHILLPILCSVAVAASSAATTTVSISGDDYLINVCLDPATGKTIWADALPRGTAGYYASPAIANGILYAAREDGVVFAARVEDQFELLSENPMGERVVASPIPVNNCLLIRGDKHLFSIAVKTQ